MTIAVILALALAGAAQDASPALKGAVTFKGEPPARRTLRHDPDHCVARGYLLDDLVVDKEGGVQWAFVRVTKGLEGRKFDAPRDPAVIRIEGHRFVPHVIGMRAGQELKVENTEAHLYNVHAFPELNKEFNAGLQGPMSYVRRMEKPEVPIKVKDD